MATAQRFLGYNGNRKTAAKMMSKSGVTIDARGALTMMERATVANKAPQIKTVIRQEMKTVKSTVVTAAKASMKKDPGKAYKAVKTVVYKGKNGGALGANINILSPRKGGARVMAINTYKYGGRSGIRRRRKVSANTKRIRGYVGADRWFILHWVDAGADRTGGKVNRGKITPRHFFTNTAKREMQLMTERLKKSISGMLGKP